MKVLLHACCAPCLSGARIGFQDQSLPFTVYWYNPNIQPLTEHDRRLSTLCSYVNDDPFQMMCPDLNDRDLYRSLIETFLSNGGHDILNGIRIESRCDICYYLRLSRCASVAMSKGYDSFSTTLLLSKYQKHDRIKAVGELIMDETGMDFLYIDLRKYWNRSLDRSRRFKLYRQKYCGCELSSFEAKKSVDPSLESIEEKPQIRIKPCNKYQGKDRY
jgi:epoxyqueuosine reductase